MCKRYPLQAMIRLYEENYTSVLELLLEAETEQDVKNVAAFGNRLCAMYEMIELVAGTVPESVEVKQSFYEGVLAKLEGRYEK